MQQSSHFHYRLHKAAVATRVHFAWKESSPSSKEDILMFKSTYLVSSLLGSNSSSKMSISVCLVVSCNLVDQHQISYISLHDTLNI